MANAFGRNLSKSNPNWSAYFPSISSSFGDQFVVCSKFDMNFVHSNRNEVHKCESKLHDLQLNATNGNNDVHFNEDA